VRAVRTFSSVQEVFTDVVLEKMEVYALQLGVFDSAERARSEQQRLSAAGVPCIVWQRDKLRIICAVASEKGALDPSCAAGNEAYIVRDTLSEVRLRVNRALGSSEEQMIRMPDALLGELLRSDGQQLDVLIASARASAQKAITEHPENPLYTHLAQSLLDWCSLMDMQPKNAQRRNYAAVTMCTLCREWRTELLTDYALSAESTASAQRTPSTAADVMPPA